MDKFEALKKRLQEVVANKNDETQFHSLVAEWLIKAHVEPVEKEFEEYCRNKAKEMTDYFMSGQYKNNNELVGE